MQLFVLVVCVLIAFAGNSVLGRMAISWGYMDALGFGLLRLISGAAILLWLCRMRGSKLHQSRSETLKGGGALTLYMVGFCLAYQDLDAGLGALILFGVVQVVMFAWGAMTGHRSGTLQLTGAGLAFAGLSYVVWPQGALKVPLAASGLMALSGIGWAIYSLLGRGVREPLVSTTLNFLCASVLMVPFVLLAPEKSVISLSGIALAVLSGAVTSGLGYALWYRVLPQLTPPVAATSQLSVPVIAILGGVVFLGEPVGWPLVYGTCAVLGGIALVIWSPKPK